MHDQITNAYVLLSGLLALLVGALFDVQPVILWVAFFGSAGGVALAKPKSPWAGALLIVAGVFLAGNLVPIIGHYAESFPQKPAAFFSPLILIGFGKKIYDEIDKGIGGLIAAAFEAIKKIIASWSAKLGGE
jgi:hypothetical protein